MSDAYLGELHLRAVAPSVPPRVIRRARLEQLLSRGTLLPVTLVCAGPGFGKTLLVASWFSGLEDAAAWLSLDESDNDIRTFWSDVLAALESSGALPLSSALRDLVPASAFGATGLRRVREGLDELTRPTILVLDDVDNVVEPAVLDSLSALLEHRPPQLKLVLLARADPAVRLHRLRLRGDFSEIRADRLAFTRDEAGELLRLNSLALTDDQVEVVHDRTQGWAAGLRLAMLSIGPADNGSDVGHFTGSDRPVAEYLVAEVLDRQPPAIRDFLLRTSIADRISGKLAMTLTGRQDSAALLAALVAANALVVNLGGTGEWYRYHPLLRELLEHRLAIEFPGEFDSLHLTAAGWFAEQGMVLSAVRHASKARAWDYLTRLISGSALPLVLTTDGPALGVALEPAAAAGGASGTLCASIAGVVGHFLRRDYDTMALGSLDVARRLEGASDEVRVPVQIFLAAVDIAHQRASASAGLSSSAAHLLALVDGASLRTLPAARRYRIIAMSNLGVGHLLAGRLGAATTGLQSAISGATEWGMELTGLSASTHLAVLDLIRGDLGRAELRVADALETTDRRGWGSEAQALPIYFTSGMVHIARDELDSAAGVIDVGLVACGRTPDLGSRLLLGIAVVNLAVASGDLDGARSAADTLEAELAGIREPPEMLARWCTAVIARARVLLDETDRAVRSIGPAPAGVEFADVQERLVLARALLRLRDVEPVGGLLDPLADPQLPYRAARVEALVLSALAADQERRDSAALRLLSTAIELAEPERILGPFRAVGPIGKALLLRYRHVVAEHSDFTAQVVAAVGGDQPRVPTAPMVDQLTERELVVLGYLPTMLKASEIASELFLSVNTVKSHLRAIYRKLEVSTRRAAVERARDLNMF